MIELSPIFLTGLFFFSSTIITLLFIINNHHIRELLKNNWKLIIFLVLLNFIFKCPLNFEFFDGLEYEDSYIYKASARSIYENKYHISNVNLFFPTSCVFGSIDNCNHSAIFVTNFLGYPYVIYIGYSIFGYYPFIANIISLAFSSISIIFLFICALLLIKDLLFAATCSFIFITIPMFNIYSSTSLTEPLSNSYAILVLMLYLTFIFYPNKKRGPSALSIILGLLALIFTLTFAILVKTTNLSLVFCLPLISIIYVICDKEIRDNKKIKFNLLITIPAILLVLIFSFTILEVLEIVDITRGDIEQDSFSLAYFKDIAPVFLKSFLNFKWHLFYFVFFLLGIFISIKNRLGLFPTIIFAFYFVLYTTHYRSYYYTRGVPVSIDEFFRYTTSMIFVYVLIVGFGIFYFLNYLKKLLKHTRFVLPFKIILFSIIVSLLFISYYFTSKNRSYFIEDEIRSRILPVKKTMEFITNENMAIITSEHILFQVYGDKELELIDFCSIDVLIPTELIDEVIKTREVIYLQTIKSDEIDRQRYPAQFEYIESKEKEILYEEDKFKIYKLL